MAQPLRGSSALHLPSRSALHHCESVATTASADSRSASWRRPFGREARSPQVRTPPFPARPPDLRRFALAIEASRSFARSPRLAAPSIRFLFVGPRFRSPLPPHGRSPFRSCGFASVAMACFREDLHLQGGAHAGRTNKNPGGLVHPPGSVGCWDSPGLHVTSPIRGERRTNGPASASCRPRDRSERSVGSESS